MFVKDQYFRCLHVRSHIDSLLQNEVRESSKDNWNQFMALSHFLPHTNIIKKRNQRSFVCGISPKNNSSLRGFYVCLIFQLKVIVLKAFKARSRIKIKWLPSNRMYQALNWVFFLFYCKIYHHNYLYLGHFLFHFSLLLVHLSCNFRESSSVKWKVLSYWYSIWVISTTLQNIFNVQLVK